MSTLNLTTQNRRSWLQRLLHGASALAIAPIVSTLATTPATAKPARYPPVRLQVLPLAGFQYHTGPRLWPELAEGQPLTLQREPDNRHDPLAVAVYWQDQPIGYLPRRHNGAIAQLLDDGQHLSAQISALQDSNNPWERVELEVWWLPERVEL
jgi:hypothetical protein